MAVSLKAIQKRSGMTASEVIDLMLSRGIKLREDGFYHSIDVEMVFEKDGRVRELGAPVIRTMDVQQLR